MNLKNLFNSKFKNPAIPKLIFGVAVFIAIFFLALKPPTDPDLFWHLKTGELMWQYKIIPYNDWYSYTMPDYPYIDFEWLTEILMYGIKNFAGYGGLSVFFALILSFTFSWLIPRSIGKNQPFYISALLGLLGALISSITFGSRPQMFTIFGLALLCFIINEYRQNSQTKLIYSLPLIFLFWANMHGGFVMGFFILAIIIILDKFLMAKTALNSNAEWLQLYQPFKSPEWKKLVKISLISFAVTFINPYAYRLYWEIYRAASDMYDKNVIMEWLSPNFHATEGMYFGFFVIFIFIILAVIKKIDILSFILIPLFLFLAFQSARNIPLFVLIALPFLIKSMETFEKTFSEIIRKKFIVIGLSALLIIYLPYLSDISNIVKSFFSEEKQAEIGSFPKKALEFLENYPAFAQKNILNNYEWGGYIIQNLKCKIQNEKLNSNQTQNANADNKSEELECTPKVFIDGRMSFWKTTDRHILKDYSEIIRLGDNYQEIINKYQIKIIFIEKDSFLGRALAFNSQWKKIYSDDVAVIYEKAE